MFIFTIHFKLCFHRCVLCNKMNKIRSHLHIFMSHHQQCFNHQIYSLNQIFNVHFLLDSFPLFNWILAQEPEMTQHGPIGLHFFFNPPDPLHLPSPPPSPRAKREICVAPVHYTACPAVTPPPPSPIPSSILGHQ
jgi:hypothetical protein